MAESNPGIPAINVKHMLFDALLEPLSDENRNAQFNYSTFRYGKEREDRWLEMEDLFNKLLSRVISDVSEVSLSGQRHRKNAPLIQVSELAEEDTVGGEDDEEEGEDEDEAEAEDDGEEDDEEGEEEGEEAE